MTELDRCPTCQHKVMFHGEQGCTRITYFGPRSLDDEICPCTATRAQLVEQDAA